MKPFNGKLAILKIQPVLQPDRKPLIEDTKGTSFSTEIISNIKVEPVDSFLATTLPQNSITDTKPKLQLFTGQVKSLPIRPVDIPDIKPRRLQKKFTCDLCQKGVGTKGGLLYHMKAHFNGRPFKCGICKRSYATKNDFDTHNKRHSGKIFNCDFCIRNFPTKQYLADHISAIHLPKVLKCQCCKKDKYFSTVKALKHHKMGCHFLALTGKRKVYSCRFCGFKTIRQSDFELHMTRAEKVRFQCKICPQKFTCIKLLSEHMKAEKNMLVKCKVCNGSFKNIRFHMNRYHHKTRACEFCKFKTSDMNAFSVHSMQCATQDKLRSKGHICSECKVYFYSERSLSVHYSKLHGTFKCTICPSRFNTKNAHRIHMRRHQKNPIRCLCPKHPMFPNMTAFNAHFERNHNSMGVAHAFFGLC
jgi:hypothetical protein